MDALSQIPAVVHQAYQKRFDTEVDATALGGSSNLKLSYVMAFDSDVPAQTGVATCSGHNHSGTPACADYSVYHGQLDIALGAERVTFDNSEINFFDYVYHDN